MKRRTIFLYFFVVMALQAGPPAPGFEETHQRYVNQFVGTMGNGVSRMMNPMMLRTERLSLAGALYSVTNIELVSLLKHDPPVAYVVTYHGNSALPDHTERPVELTLNSPTLGTTLLTPPKDYKLRALGDDEVRALKEIRGGKEIAMTDAGLVGAIRAQVSCMKCHDCKAGDLLGAFSYSLKKEAVLKDAGQPGGALVFPKAAESGTGAGDLK